MYTKDQVIKRASELGSKATTVRGAIRALRGSKVKALPIPGDDGRPGWCRKVAHGGQTREQWRAASSRARFNLRMERAARETLERLGLLDLEDWRGLISATGDEHVARREAARMRRMTPQRRKSHLLQILLAPQRADEIFHTVYNDLAVRLARTYHARIAPIYQSSRATIEYGPAQDMVDWDAYSKAYRHPARWRNPGVTARYSQERGPVAEIETSRGKGVVISIHRHVVYGHPALLDGDLYAIERHGVIERYNPNDQKTGVALRIPAMAGEAETFEHGADIAECRAEYERKMEMRRQKALQLLHDPDYRRQRKARLIARLCGGLACTVEDARSLGYCRAGIDAFRDRYGLMDTATASQLRATGNPSAVRVISVAASRVVGKRHA